MTFKRDINKEYRCKVCGTSEKDTPKFYYEKGLCNKHYIQMIRYHEIRDKSPSKKYIHKCYVCGNTNGNFIIWKSKGELEGKPLCTKHYKQMSDHGEIKDKFISTKKTARICCVCEKTEDVIYNPSDGKMYCRRHYSQLYDYGKIIEETVFDRNKYIIKGNYAEVILKNVEHEEVARTLIDIEDLERVIKYKWALSSWNYATCGSKNIEFFMLQNFILGKKGLIDHKNRNSLDNRKFNLNPSNKSLNALNCDLRINNKTGVTGVSYNKRVSAYRIYINWEGERLELGHKKKLNDAIIVRLKKEKELLGELAPQKQLFEQYNI